MELQVTIFTAAICGLIFFWLSYQVSQSRMALKVTMGDGGDPKLNARIRAHANFAEYVPMILILMGLIERAIGYSIALGIIALVLIGGRIAHALGMEREVSQTDRKGPHMFRSIGTAGTWIALLALSLWAFVIAIRLV